MCFLDTSALLPALEYCFPVSGSAVNCHLISFLSVRCVRLPDFVQIIVSCLNHSRGVAGLCILYKVQREALSVLWSRLAKVHALLVLMSQIITAQVLRSRTYQISRCSPCAEAALNLACVTHFYGYTKSSFLTLALSCLMVYFIAAVYHKFNQGGRMIRIF